MNQSVIKTPSCDGKVKSDALIRTLKFPARVQPF
jgi:hypothetical protein